MRRRDDDGFTLVELLVSIALLAMVMAAATTTLVGMQRHIGATRVRYEDLGDARVAINAMSTTLRAAIALNPGDSAFLSAGDDAVTFYSNVFVADDDDEAPKLVTYEVVDGDLTETVTDGDLTTVTLPGGATQRQWTADGAPRVRTLARDVDLAQPLLTYFGDTTSTDTADALVPVAGALSATDREQVRHVAIDVRVDTPDDYGVEDTQLRGRVRVPNLYYAEEETP